MWTKLIEYKANKAVNYLQYLAMIMLLATAFVACKNSNRKHYSVYRGEAIGTTYSVKCSNCSTLNVTYKIDSIVDLLNKSVSTYHDSSLISKINAGDTTLEVDALFKKLFMMSKKIYKETDGYFDPSVGALVNHYGFGPKKKIITDTEVFSTNQAQYVGFEKYELVNNLVVKTHKNSYLDFNAIAKGYLVDLIALELEQNGVNDFLIEIGGEIKASGYNEYEKPWLIAIEAPNSDGSRSIWTKLRLENQSMATSGNYRKYLMDDKGNKKVHTINPKTGLAKENKLLSVSVLGSIDCSFADAYATAFLAMGLEKTINFLNNHKNLYAVLIFRDKNYQIKTSFVNFADN
jgi:thiamine biosynthesis lipoprotein